MSLFIFGDDMKPIQETNEFITSVPLLEETDRVKGGEEGPSNAQAIALANRTHYLKLKQDKLISDLQALEQELDGLTPDSIGAETKGRAVEVISAHVADADPHKQYLTATRGNALYVDKTLANVPNGYVQLDSAGKLPAGIADALKARYIVVNDEATRLALPGTTDLTIAAQKDDGMLYYLNAGDDPSVDSNWIKGNSASLSGVVSIFGRTGVVLAQAGDYTADQITETLTRLFVSSTEKQTWNQKQEALVSGTNIKTINSYSIMGSGDLVLKPADIGAADKTHKHVAADISDLPAVISGQFKAGTNVTLSVDPNTKVVTINASGGGSTVSFNYIDRLGSVANQVHIMTVNSDAAFQLQTYAMKLEKGATGQSFVMETFDASSNSFYTKTSYSTFNGLFAPVFVWAPTMAPYGSRYAADIDTNIVSMIQLTPMTRNIVPTMTSDSGINGYVPFATSSYSTDYASYKAFANLSNGGTSDCWASSKGSVPTDAAPQWLGVTLPADTKITGYSFFGRAGGGQFQTATPSKFKLQGSADKTTWDDLEDFHTNTDNSPGAEFIFQVRPSKAYRHYRLYITGRNTNDTTTDFVCIWKMRLFIDKPVVLQGATASDLYSFDNTGTLFKLSSTTDSDITAQGFTVAPNLTASVLNNAGIKKVVGLESLSLNSKVIPGPQIAIMNTPLNARIFNKVNALTLAGAGAGTNKNRYAVSIDNQDYYVYANSAWTKLGPLTASAASAALLAQQGMTQTFPTGAITALMSQLGINTLTQFSVAYGLVPAALTDSIGIDTCTLTVDNADAWKVQTPAEVEIRYGNGTISFKTIAAGDYKFAYRLP